MTLENLFRLLEEKNIRVHADRDELVVRAPRGAMDPDLAEVLKKSKAELLVALQRKPVPGAQPAAGNDDNGLRRSGPRITPGMLPLVKLSQDAIDDVVTKVPGGAANVQDIYPLVPLQEGILYHHLAASEGDPYLLPSLLGFARRQRLDSFLAALQAVIDRHDILRTGIVWQGLEQPVQVVCRRAVLPVQEVELDPAQGDIARQLEARYDPRHFRLDVSEAPLLRCYLAEDKVNSRWLLRILAHHLVIDHATLELLFGEALAFEQGKGDELPAPVPFRNFVAQVSRGMSEAEHEAFFRDMLGDIDEPTAPFGILDVRGDGGDITEARLEVERAVAKAIRRHTRRLGVSAASVLHLAWAMVLGRLTGRDDVVFGTVLFGRLQGGVQADRVLGLFINTLPLRIRLGDEGVQESIRRVHASFAQLLRHEHAPLALAQRCSRVAPPDPLFSTLFNYRHSAASAETVANVLSMGDGIELLGGEERTNYPVAMNVDDFADGLVLTAQTRAPIEPGRLCAYLHTALERLADALERAPSTPLRALDVLPESERRQLLIDWNRTARRYDADHRLHHLVTAQAARAPGAIAVEFGDATLTYGELERRSNRLGRHLRALGVRPGTPVGVFMERSLEMVLALYGILKAGGAYVPLDPEYPPERVAFMARDANAPVLLTQAHLRGRLPSTDATVVCLDADWPAIERESDADIGETASADDIAYVIYTSGSTGRPKGVLNSHRGIVNRLLWMQDAFGLSAGDRVLQKTPFSFDVSVWEFFWPLITGARLVVANPGGHRDPAYLSRLILEKGITTLHFVPSMLAAYLDQTDLNAPCVKRVIVSGEALSSDLRERFFRAARAELHNLYGPTEAAVDVTHWACRRDDRGRTVPIGRPVANTRLYILDRAMRPVLVGTAGELHIGGVQVARGSLNRPDLTAEKFIPDPFDDNPDARLYKTGDLARFLPDGNIEYLGRIDHQVKLRGFRIELGEIESVIARAPGVRTAVVTVREDTPGDQRLAAYLVAGQDGAPDIEQLRHRVEQSLPAYMVPSAYVFLDALPLTPSGKVDRRALPAPRTGVRATDAAAPPQGELERVMARIWEELLDIDQVQASDTFFDLGGHSLLSIKAVERFGRETGIRVAPTDLINQTLRQLVTGVERQRAAAGGATDTGRPEKSRDADRGRG